MATWYEDPIGMAIINKKYLHESEKTFDDMVERISTCFGSDMQDKIKSALLSAAFFPAGRSLYALGCKGKFSATTSNCYILPSPNDDWSSIFDVGKAMAIILSQGGGCGINLSKLCPKEAKGQSATQTNAGVVSFLEFYHTICAIISQNGRRGALLIGLNCDHPDLETFLEVKQNNEAIQSANTSVLFDDAFMQAVENGESYTLKFNATSTGRQVARQISARQVFFQFCAANKEYAEPGGIFIDRARNWNLMSADPDYQIEISNPCGEFFGNDFSTCNLGSINLYGLISNKFKSAAVLDAELLKVRVNMAVRALDEILDYGYDLQPLDANRKNIEDYRTIGLGVFGLADALIALGIKYGSAESIVFCEQLFRTIFLQALDTSNRLAREKGSFGKCRSELLLKAPILKFVEAEDPGLWERIGRYGLRNASLLSIAPTGTISTMCGFSGGIEPLFRLSYKRTTHSLLKKGRFFDVFAHSVEELLNEKGCKKDMISLEKLQQEYAYLVCAHDINPVDRVRVQAAIQKYVDNAISSTVNMPEGSTTEEVMKVYKTAWKSGCKGITVFVEGCKRTAIMNAGNDRREQISG